MAARRPLILKRCPACGNEFTTYADTADCLDTGQSAVVLEVVGPVRGWKLPAQVHATRL